jgi:hypothetical protein
VDKVQRADAKSIDLGVTEYQPRKYMCPRTQRSHRGESKVEGYQVVRKDMEVLLNVNE